MTDRGRRHPEARALLEILGGIQRRWRMRNLVRGLAIVVTASLVLVVLSGAGMDRLRFSPGAVAGFRIVTYLVLAGLIIRFLILPFLRRPSPEEVALYLEEHEPELNAEVLSALAVVNADDPGDEAALSASPRSLARAVVLQAVKACREVEDGRRIESRSLRRSSGVLVAASVATLVLLALGPRSVRTGATALALPTRGAEAVSPYRLGILPGEWVPEEGFLPSPRSWFLRMYSVVTRRNNGLPRTDTS